MLRAFCIQGIPHMDRQHFFGIFAIFLLLKLGSYLYLGIFFKDFLIFPKIPSLNVRNLFTHACKNIIIVILYLVIHDYSNNNLC